MERPKRRIQGALCRNDRADSMKRKSVQHILSMYLEVIRWAVDSCLR